jgi:hypothetical protein
MPPRRKAGAFRAALIIRICDCIHSSETDEQGKNSTLISIKIKILTFQPRSGFTKQDKKVT